MSGLELLLPAIASAAGSAGSAVAAAAPTIGLIGTGVGAVGGVASAIAGRNEAKMNAKLDGQRAEVEAGNLQKRATEEQAASQREAEQTRRRTKMILSEQEAKAAAGGGGSGGSIADIMASTEAQGKLSEQRDYYLGETRAAGLKDQANMTRWSAGANASAAKYKANADYTGTLLETAAKGATSFADWRKTYK
jgi:hypothetical protein